MEMEKNIGFTSVEVDGERLTIRLYNPERDENKVLELWKIAFDNEISVSLWNWKYINNPYDTAILICENKEGLPVVLYGGTPYLSNYQGKKIRMIHLTDIMSHPDYRKNGLFIHTANAYFENFGKMEDTFVMYGFPGKYHFDIGVKYLQYSYLGKGVAYFSSNIKNMIDKEWLLSGKITQINLSDLSFNLSFDQIWKQLEPDYPLSVIRNAAYIKWRFFKHPFNKYELWCYKPVFGRQYTGYMAIKINEKKAIIVDLLISQSEKTVKKFMLEIARMLMKRGIERIETWIPENHFLVKMLQSTGFEKKQEPTGIVPTIRIFDKSLEKNYATDNFYYSMGDGDLL